MRTLKRISRVILLCVFLVGPGGDVRPAQSAEPQDSFDELMRVIRTGNAYQRQQAIPTFAHSDDPRVVPVLIDLLKDSNPGVRTYAAQQLDRLADRRSTEALAAALGDSNGNVRNFAAQALGKIGSEEHVPALVAAVMDNLPDPNQTWIRIWPSWAALEAIGTLSSEAPPEIMRLLRRISDGKKIADEDWWRLLEGVVRCLGQIGDREAWKELQRVNRVLSRGYQDYKTWYAVRKALAAINPEQTTFDRPAADILNSFHTGKITEEGIRHRWLKPLVKLGSQAVEDLEWSLRFKRSPDRGRKMLALDALGEIGGASAAKILRQYIRRLSDSRKPNRQSQRSSDYLLRRAMLALLKADPTTGTAGQVAEFSQTMNGSYREHLMRDVLRCTPDKIPTQTTVLLYETVLLAHKHAGTSGLDTSSITAQLLADVGGRQAGTVLSRVLLGPDHATIRRAAARALGTIKGYDPVPTLIEASRMPRMPVDVIAEAMGRRNDRRATSALQDMAGREQLSRHARLWIAAALARLGTDYDRNAAMVRQALPASLDQAKWLGDTETINAVAVLVETEGYAGQHAIATLEAIGSEEAFEALRKSVDLERAIAPRRLHQLSTATARMAEKLGHDSRDYYAGISTVTEAVPGWFEIHQQPQPLPWDRSSYEAVENSPALARKLWATEAYRRLDLAAKKGKEGWESNITEQALWAVEKIFAPELVPVLERIVRESRARVQFHGKYSMVYFYRVRSIAAKILTERTGRQYTFVDVDGRTHPGGWNPSKEE